jgi:hypothetical protein
MFFGDSGSIAGGTMYGGRLPLRPIHVEEECVVLLHERCEALDRSRVGRREVDVAAPDPALRLLGNVLVHAGRLGVVDDDHVPAASELLRVHLVVALPRAPLLGREVLGVPLERVVHQLRRVEELLASEDDLPVGVDARVAHERDERVEDLRDAASERGRREVEDPQTPQLLGHLADLLDQRPAREVRVVGKRLVPDSDRLKHRVWLSYASGPLSGRRLTRRTDDSL